MFSIGLGLFTLAAHHMRHVSLDVDTCAYFTWSSATGVLLVGIKVFRWLTIIVLGNITIDGGFILVQFYPLVYASAGFSTPGL
jgi:heme/copper-type cytochrome/quinol oxidase subunit 1